MSERSLARVATPIPRQSNLGELSYERLKEIIIAGAFPPNEKIDGTICFGGARVSTTPARDAINRLISEGALAYVAPKTVVVPSLTVEALDEITATRLAIEGLAAERSVLSVTPGDVAGLAQMQARIIAGLDQGNYREVLKINREFHFTIYRMSGWPRLVAIIETMWLRVGPSFNALYPAFAMNRQGVANHLAAIDGLNAKDGAKVRAAIENDIRDGYVRMKAMIESQN